MFASLSWCMVEYDKKTLENYSYKVIWNDVKKSEENEVQFQC